MDIPGVGWRVEFGQNLDGQPIFDEALDRSGPLPAGINDTRHLAQAGQHRSVPDRLVVGGRRDVDAVRALARAGDAAHRPRRLQRQQPAGGVRLLPAGGQGRRGAVQDRHRAGGGLPDAVRRHRDEPGGVEDGRAGRLLAAVGLLDPVLRRARPALPPGQLRVVPAQARLEDAGRRQRRRVRRVQGPGQRPVQRRQRRPRDPDRRHRRPVAHDGLGLRLPGRDRGGA